MVKTFIHRANSKLITHLKDKAEELKLVEDALCSNNYPNWFIKQNKKKNRVITKPNDSAGQDKKPAQGTVDLPHIPKCYPEYLRTST